MKKSLKKLISLALTFILCFGCFGIIGFAASDVLTYAVTGDGTAEVVKCDEDAEGAIVIPSVVEIKGTSYNVSAIAESAFENCTSVASVSIAEGITSIGSRAFANCTALTDVYVPASLSVCQYTAFNGCGTVTVHCYSSNYQFFTVYGLNQNLKIDIIDSEEESGSIGGSDSGMTISIVEMIKRIILSILYLFLNRSSETA